MTLLFRGNQAKNANSVSASAIAQVVRASNKRKQ